MLFYDYNKNYNLNRKDMTNAAYENYLFFLSIYKDILGSVDTRMNKSINEYNTDPEYTYMVYVKGVLMYDSLYQLIGKNAFVRALKKYAQSYCYKNVSPEHLIACFENASNANLESFFYSLARWKGNNQLTLYKKPLLTSNTKCIILWHRSLQCNTQKKYYVININKQFNDCDFYKALKKFFTYK